MTSAFLFNTCLSANDSKYSQLLYLISCHPSFKSKVNQFLEILNPTPTFDNLIKLGSFVFAFILPEYPHNHHKNMATQLFQSIETHQKKVTYTNLTEYLLKICSYCVQNIDVRSAIGFLQIIKSRVTSTFIVNCKTPANKKIVHSHYQLEIFGGEHILKEADIQEKLQREEIKHVYFQEKVSLFEEELEAIQPEEVVVIELKSKIEEVIPWGYICQDFIHELSNNQFEVKNSYRIKKCKKLDIVDKVEYFIVSNELTNNQIRDFTVNQEIFLTVGVIGAGHLPDDILPAMSKPLSIARINQAFAKKTYLQKLKDLHSGQNRYWNILSQFFSREEFNIDELTITREKLMIRRKENLLGIAGKETIKKEDTNYDDEARNLGTTISKNLSIFLNEETLKSNIKQLQTTLKATLEEDKNINVIIEKHLSQQETIQKDSSHPFMEDILQYVKMIPLQLLIIGRPKSGKSTLAKAIAKTYNLVYISVESMVQKVFQRVKFFQENPPEADQDGNLKDGLMEIQKCILQDLNNGKTCEDQDVLDLINNELEKQFTQSRGFILDLPFEYNKFWIENLINNRIYLPKIQCKNFTHVIQTEQTQEQWKYFTNGLMEKPDDFTISSAYDRYLLKKPKPQLQEGEQQPEVQEGDKPQPLIQANLLENKWKQSNFSLIQHITQHINPHQYLKIQNSYRNVEECLSILSFTLYKISLPKKIEGNEKQLLSVGLEEAKVFRKWSPWGLIDCVELCKQRLIAGKFQFAAEYGGRVFVFESQINLNAFLINPRRYLEKLPELPKKTNICIVGPRKSGKKTIAKLLSSIYGLQVVNLQEIIESVLNRQRSFETHIPSNFDKRSASIHLSEGQFKEFSKGNILNAKQVLPIILYQLGINLQKKPLGWGVEKQGQQGGENIEGEQKKPVKKAKKKDKNAEDERPKTPPAEDLSLKDLIPQINHFGKLNELKGYIIIGYPNNEEQLNSLKQFNIPIDKLIILSDNSEENPNKNLQTRLNDAELEQVALFSAAIAPVKEALGEDICKEILIEKSPEEIINKIRQIIDPFFLKVDDDAVNRVCADKQEEGDPIPLGFCGEYCPVSLKSGWLIRGKDQFELGLQGKRFKFSGEKQLAQFKQNPVKYLSKEGPALPPRIMLMGIRGVGLKTQLLKFNQKYRIPILSFRETLLQQLENEKNKRNSERYYMKGFKKPQYDEEGKQVEDPEINDDGPDFDRRTNQIQVVKNIFNGINQIFINGNFFDVEEEKVATNFVELLAEARRLPEVVLLLTSDQGKWLERVLDKKKISQELEELKAKKRQEKEKQREDAKRKALEAGEEYQEPAAEEEDPDIPKLEDLIAQKQQGLKAQRQADNAKLEQLGEAFKAWNIEVITIKCQRQPKHVTDRINYVLKPYIEDRISRWEKNHMLSIENHRVPDFLNNFVVTESRFGKLHPFTLMRNATPQPLIYKDRIYYLKDQEERDYIIRNPHTLIQNQPPPKDLKIIPIVFIIGKTKTGKTTLAKSLSDKFAFTKINIQEIVEVFSKDHLDSDINAILNEIKSGKVLSDESIVTLIEKRTSLSDCENGWVLDGLPSNKRQCQLLNKKGIVPNAVFSLKMTDLDIKRRALQTNSQEYEYQIEVIHSKLETNKKSLLDVEVYYLTKHNTFKYLDGQLSKWGIFEICKKEIQKKVKAKKNFVRELVVYGAANVTDVGLSFSCILSNLSEYLNYCPISYKIRREYVKLCLKSYEHLALFNRKFYVFKTQKELNDFLANPDTFTVRGNAFLPPQQVPVEQLNLAANKYENKGHCMFELSKKKLLKGNSFFGLHYKQKYFLLSSPKSLKLFIKNPALYEMMKLPDKLPVELQKKNDLKKIAKRNDCSAFLEHHLSNIMMRSLAQLGYRRPKYPTLGSKESALKFLSISLKANNPNKDEEYRQKYADQLHRFIKESNYSQEIRNQLEIREKANWTPEDQKHLLNLCEEYHSFLKVLETTEKSAYFSDFIR